MAERKALAYEHGARGWLDLILDHEGERVAHAGLYRYVGVVDGHHAFAPATSEPVVYLTDREIVRFDTTAGASG